MIIVPFLSPAFVRAVIAKKAKEYGAKKIHASVFERVYEQAQKWENMDNTNTEAKKRIVRGVMASIRGDLYEVGETIAIEKGMLIMQKGGAK